MSKQRSLAEQRPDPEAILRKIQPAPQRASLRIYLGYARGCGTTTAMLEEGRRRAGRGTDVVVAGLEPRPDGSAHPALENLEVLPGAPGGLDVEALLARNPEVACIGSLVRPDTTGKARFHSVERLKDAGITVIGTVHTGELASLRKALAAYVPIEPGSEPLEDRVLFSADEIEMVDITPEKLIERLRQGLILPPDQAAGALQREFRAPVLQNLREGTFRLVAEHTERRLMRYMRDAGIKAPWESRARVLVCVGVRGGAENLIRRAAKMAAVMDGSLTVATVRTQPRSDDEKQRLGKFATLVHELGGEYVTLYGRNASEAVADYAGSSLITEVILGRGPKHPRWKFWRRSFSSDVIRRLKDVDVHVLRMG